MSSDKTPSAPSANVDTSERRVLEQIGESYLTINQLSDRLGRSYGSVYASVVSLERKGYVRGSAGRRDAAPTGAVCYTVTGRGAEAAKETV